jgi:tRNA pseudouridine38-40 synthase
MPLIKLTVEYDGTTFSGYQSQEGGNTVQDRLEAALLSLTGANIRIRGAGRTDSGVHALGQVVAFEYEGGLSNAAIKRALNALLPDEISVLSSDAASAGFDPRRDASARVYEYRIINRAERPALDRARALHVPQLLDVQAMSRGAGYIVGRHDFRAFTTSDAGPVIRQVYECVCWREGETVSIRVRANAFAKRIVRRTAGALVQVGLGRWKPEVIAHMLSDASSPFVAPSLGAHGLYLMEVEYDGVVDPKRESHYSTSTLSETNAG